MTIAEQLRQEGEQRGTQKGIQLDEQKGIEKGEKLASLKIAQHMLASGLIRTAVKQFTGLSDLELDDLARQ